MKGGPIDVDFVAVVVLGIFHGLNPAQGWLFAVFMARSRKSLWHLPATIATVSTGHAASLVLVIALALLASAYTNLTPLAVGIVLTSYGTYRFLRGWRHRAVRLRIGYPELALWGFLAGIAHGSGLTLVPFLTSQTAIELGAFHWLAMATTMFVIALLTTGVLGLSSLKRIWVNFDAVWSTILVVMGSAMLLTTILPLEPAGA